MIPTTITQKTLHNASQHKIKTHQTKLKQKQQIQTTITNTKDLDKANKYSNIKIRIRELATQKNYHQCRHE